MRSTTVTSVCRGYFASFAIDEGICSAGRRRLPRATPRVTCQLVKPRELHNADEPNELRRQLSLLLHAWTVDGSQIMDDWDASDAERWQKLLPVLEPVAPRTVLDGAQRSAALLGLDWEALVSSEDAYISGTRVAFRTRLKGFSMAMSVRQWSLYVVRNGHEDDTLIKWLTTRHDASITEASSGWFIAFDHRPQRAAIPALLEQAVRLGDEPRHLLRIWDLANCLLVTDELAQGLPKSVKTTLAQLVRSELERHAAHWTLDVDLTVYAFVERGDSERRAAIRRSRLPSCRFTRLVEGQEVASYLVRGSDEDYYSSRVVEYCYLADILQVNELLNWLSPGVAFETLLLVIQSNAPRLLAELLRKAEPSETINYMLGWLRSDLHIEHQSMDLSTEWELVQSLSRKLSLVSQNVEPPGLIAQALRDLSFHLANPGVSKENRRHSSDQYWSDDIWKWASKQNATDRLIEPLTAFLRGSEASEVALILGIKFLSWTSSEAASVRRLQEAIVKLYTNLLTPAANRSGSILHLPSCGPDLASFWSRVGANQYLSGRWLFPLSWYELAQKAQDQSTDEKPDYRFDSPFAAREHISILAAQADQLVSFEPVFDALHRQALEISTLTWPTHPFSWWALSRRWRSETSERPLFDKIGALYARDKRGVIRMSELVQVTSDVRVLADLLAGALLNDSVANVVRDRLLQRANEVLREDNPVALGEALDVAVAALAAGEPRLAERFARRGIAILDQLSAPKPNSFRGEALLCLANALAQQGLWNEIVQLDLSDAEKADELATRALRVEAFMKLSQKGDAARELDLILARHRRHAAAWRARCTLAVLGGDFQESLRLLEKARRLLESDYDSVFESIETAARAEDSAEAPALPSLLDNVYLIAPVGEAPSVVIQEPAAAPAAPDASLSAVVLITSEPTCVELAIVTILEEEYEAVKRTMGSPKVVRDQNGETYPNRFGWTRGTLMKDDNSLVDVILARTDTAGSTSSQAAAMRTIDRFRPRCLLVIGVAGGIGKDALQQGDIVMATDVWYYEYGKVDRGNFTARHRSTYQCDSRLVNAAQNFKNSSQTWVDCCETPPRVGHVPKFHRGSIASGEKVIDDLDAEFFRRVLDARPELLAIEMEGAGAAAAVSDALKENRNVAFGMIRGISDMPKRISGDVGGSGVDGSGTEERDNWKPYASAIAANFVKEWVRSEHWPRFAD